MWVSRGRRQLNALAHLENKELVIRPDGGRRMYQHCRLLNFASRFSSSTLFRSLRISSSCNIWRAESCLPPASIEFWVICEPRALAPPSSSSSSDESSSSSNGAALSKKGSWSFLVSYCVRASPDLRLSPRKKATSTPCSLNNATFHLSTISDTWRAAVPYLPGTRFRSCQVPRISCKIR